MPAPPSLRKAELREITFERDGRVSPGPADKTLKVQFNPETLTVNFSNQNAAGDQRGGGAIQFVGRGQTKLSLELWFDVTAPLPGSEDGPTQNQETPPDDVRKLTEKVAYFMKPKASGQADKFIPPGVRFVWGSFLFDGVMESLSEKLEFFSADGKPLRAQVTIGLAAQEIQFKFNDQGGAGGQGAGTQPVQNSKPGDTVQSVAAKNGQSDWRKVADANGVEQPHRLTPGTPLKIPNR
jgi:hypothetical protein